MGVFRGYSGFFDDIWTTFVRKRSHFGAISARLGEQCLHAAGRFELPEQRFLRPAAKKKRRSRPRRRNRAVPDTPATLAPGAPAACGCGCWTARRGVRNLYGNVRFVYGFVRFLYGFAGKSWQKRGFGRPGSRTGAAQGSGNPCQVVRPRGVEYDGQQPGKSARRERKRALIGRKRGLTGCRTLWATGIPVQWRPANACPSTPGATDRTPVSPVQRHAPYRRSSLPRGYSCKPGSRLRHGLFNG